MKNKILENLEHSIRIAEAELKEVQENPIEGSTVLEESMLQLVANLEEVKKILYGI
jgi:hypothetical protein